MLEKEVLSALVTPFFQSGASSLYVAACHGRLFVGIAKANVCPVCKQTPTNITISSDTDLDQAIQILSF